MKRVLILALAFMGIVIGAGFASGQEMMQYFVAFGHYGLFGALISAGLTSLVVTAVFRFASYLLADEHGEVLNFVGAKWFTWIFDIALLFAMFAIGFVMFAGAGTNLNQQWGIPTWIGSLLMLLLVLVVGMLDVDRITNLIGAVTPFILALLLLVFVVTVFDPWAEFHVLDAAAQQVQTGLPQWIYAAINHSGLTMMTALSMLVVIAGNSANMRSAGAAGIVGGVIYFLVLILAVFSLYLRVETVGQDDMPMLTLVNEIHPIMGMIMAVVIYLMIFNTAISLFYAFTRRITARRPEKFRTVYLGVCIFGFALSFFGFRTLVSYVYPVIGIVGFLLGLMLLFGWFKYRKEIRFEASRRDVVAVLVEKKFDPAVTFTQQEQDLLDKAISYSNLDDEQFKSAIVDDVETDESYDLTDWDDVEATNPDPQEVQARKAAAYARALEIVSAGADDSEAEVLSATADSELVHHSSLDAASSAGAENASRGTADAAEVENRSFDDADFAGADHSDGIK